MNTRRLLRGGLVLAGWAVLGWGLWSRPLPQRVPGESLASLRRQYPPLDAFTMWLAEADDEERRRFIDMSCRTEHTPDGRHPPGGTP